MITAEDSERLASAIRDAEARTAGEIVVIVAAQAGAYRAVPLLWALLAALTVPWPLIWITTLGPSRIFQLQLVAALVLSVVLSLPKRRYKLVPGFVKRAQAHEAATREFVSRGLTRTRERTGVLIYVAAAEHYAEILADIGIADRVDERVWRETVADLIDAIKAGHAADGLLAAIDRVGAVLAEHAPARADDIDEFPNKVILI
jgi:putative membrane protein